LVLRALSKCLPGLILEIGIGLLSTAEAKKAQGPNEALTELRGIRLVFGEEPEGGMQLDGAFLKKLCGAHEFSQSEKNGHQMRFSTTFHAVVCSNADQPLPIRPVEGTHEKRVGYRMLHKFVAPGDPRIDDATIFAKEADLAETIGRDCWIPLLRLFHRLYHNVKAHGFDATESEYRIEYATDAGSHGVAFWVEQFEVYMPPAGDAGDAEAMGMEQIYNSLAPRGLDQHMTSDEFYKCGFKERLIVKIDAWRAAHGVTGRGGPRFKRPATGSKRFYGVRLRA